MVARGAGLSNCGQSHQRGMNEEEGEEKQRRCEGEGLTSEGNGVDPVYQISHRRRSSKLMICSLETSCISFSRGGEKKRAGRPKEKKKLTGSSQQANPQTPLRPARRWTLPRPPRPRAASKRFPHASALRESLLGDLGSRRGTSAVRAARPGAFRRTASCAFPTRGLEQNTESGLERGGGWDKSEKKKAD